MIRFYNADNFPPAFWALVDKIPSPEPIEVKANEVLMITTISEPPEHVAKVHEWLVERTPGYLAYRGRVISLAIVPREVASLLRLSLPL